MLPDPFGIASIMVGSSRTGHRPQAALFLAVLAAICFASCVNASSGDRHPLFKKCVQNCASAVCDPSLPSKGLSPMLRLFRWTCRDDCAYQCTHQVTSALLQHPNAHERVHHQYYGKWAFWRLWGMQEPASVLFSLGNFWVHWNGWRKVKRRVNDSIGVKWWMLALAVVQMNTWFWSAVFHTRDTPFTEKMDYFSATLTICFTVHYTLLRLFNLFPYPPARPSTPRARYLLSITFVVLYFSHISYLLSTPRFNYGWNILFNTSLGAIHLTLWSIFSLRFSIKLPYPLSLLPTPYPPLDPLQISPKPRYSKMSAVLVLATTAAMSFELFDFPPFARIVDAHSLWHAATIGIARGWYEFMIRDAAMLEAARLTYDPSGVGRMAEKMADDAKASNTLGGSRQFVEHHR